jgi:uncharacterized protein HemX
VTPPQTPTPPTPPTPTPSNPGTNGILSAGGTNYGLAIGIPLAVLVLLIIIGAGAYSIYKQKNKVANSLDKNHAHLMERSKMTGHSALMLD